MRHSLCLACLLIALPAPLIAQTAQSQSGTTDSAAPKDDPNKVICKREKTLGSRIPTGKTCLTRKEWQARAEAARELMESRNLATGDN